MAPARRSPRPPSATRQAGAALLLAMLCVALVATLAAAALAQQWRGIEVEQHERDRVQAGWILVGALDWARLILSEDARTGGADHLAEPWSIALREARLSTFLAIDQQQSDLGDKVFLSGQIVDAQARLNVANLVSGAGLSEPDVAAFGRLFEILGLDPGELAQLAEAMRRAVETDEPDATGSPRPLLPTRLADLAWMGLTPATLQRLAPYATVLPVRTPVNLNTAPAEVIAARLDGLDLSDARALVNTRARSPFRGLGEVVRVLPDGFAALNPAQVSVASRFFEVHGRLRLDALVVEERSLVQRNGLAVSVLWRERGVADLPAADGGTR